MQSPERVRLALLTLAFALAGCAFAVGTPLFQTPDEPAHVDLVRHHARHPFEPAGPDLRVRHGVRVAVAEVGLPDGGPLRWDRAPTTRPRYRPFDEFPGADRPASPEECQVSCQNYHFIHPPAYYVLLSPLAWLLRRFGFPVEVLGLRLAGVALVSPVVVLGWYAGRQVWGEGSRRPMAVAAALAFAAPLAASAAAVNNDALALVLAAAAVAVTARVLRAGTTPRRAALLGAVVGAGLLTKGHFLAVAPVAAVAVALGLPRRWRPALASLVGFAAPAGAGAAWWVGNLVHFGALTPGGSEILLEHRRGPWTTTSYLAYALEHGGKLVNRLWGDYGWQTVAVPGPWRTVLSVAAGSLAVGWLACRRWRRPSPAGARMALLGAIPVLLAAAAVYASFEVYRTTGQAARGLSGRYIYAGLPVIALGAVGAASAIAGRLRRFVDPGVLLAGGFVVAAAGTALSLVRALHGLYQTRSTDLLLERAEVVAPLPGVGPRLGVLVVAWAGAVAGSAWLAGRAPAREAAPAGAVVGGPAPLPGRAPARPSVPARLASLPNLSGLDASDERATDSGIEVHPLYTAADLEGWDPERRLGEPGRPPFTRGSRPAVERGRWSVRQECRFASAAEVNACWRALVASGATELACTFDLPTELGYDSDDPVATDEVGRDGLAVDSTADVRALLADLPLDRLAVALGADTTGPVLLLLYELVARERGFAPARLRGSVQNDVLSEHVSRGTAMLPVPAAMRLVTDTIAYCCDRLPAWSPVCVSGYDLREAGATAVQELAFGLSIGVAYLDAAAAAGLDVDQVAPRMAFSWDLHSNLFEEVAKLRAARRMWSRLVADRFGARHDRSLAMRCHARTSGAVLTASQPVNNVARITVQAMAAVLGGAESLHTAAFDEPSGGPGAQAARVAVRTQQVLAHEAGLGDTADPLGGSYFLESLTDELEREGWALIEKVDGLGGAAAAISAGWVQEEIERAASARLEAVERGERVVVGVNGFVDEAPVGDGPRPADAPAQRAQAERLARFRCERDGGAVGAALDVLGGAAASLRPEGPTSAAPNLLVPLREALRAGATVGEVSEVLRTAAADALAG